MTVSNFLAASDASDVFAGPIQIFAGDEPSVVTQSETLTSGLNLVAGTVVARTAASGKLVAFVSGGTGGAGAVVGVLVHDCNASSADTACQIYVSGCFNSAYLGWGSNTAIQQKAALDTTKIVQKPLNWSQG